MENNDIKHIFNLKKGPKIEILIRETDTNVIILSKHTYMDGVCEYFAGDYYLDSFSDNHHKDYPIEKVMESMCDEKITLEDTFWNHP